MSDIAHSIDLDLSQALQDRSYRLRFFWAESSALIAEALVALRKRRGLSQTQVAELTDTKQPAISRAEQADYQNWNIKTLRTIAEALDARVRVLIQPSEDVLREYDGDGDITDNAALNTDVIQPSAFVDPNNLIYGNNTFGASLTGFGIGYSQKTLGFSTSLTSLSNITAPYWPANPTLSFSSDAEKIQLRQLIVNLQKIISDQAEKIAASSKSHLSSSVQEPAKEPSLPLGQKGSVPTGILVQ